MDTRLWTTCLLLMAAAFTTAIHPAVPHSGDAYYPQFHVRPPTNWINDPNGPFRDPLTNVVHLWMQYNPDRAVWGNMSWWHTVTMDYVTWQQVGVSMTNDAAYDIGGVFSGSVSLDERGDPVIFYTCVDAHGVQRQCIATPDDRHGDPLLTRWVKSSMNPILSTLPNENGLTNFRDPTTGWVAASDDGDAFYFLTGGSIVPPGGEGSTSAVAMVPIFKSLNIAALTSNFSFTGKFLFEDPYELSMMFECPDFFDLPTYISGAQGANGSTTWVVKASSMTTRHDYFYLGIYDAASMKFGSTTTPVAVDYGMWYASKTFWDASLQARILFGWINEEDTEYEARGWAGLQSIPRVVVYDDLLETVRTYPLPALEALRGTVLASVAAPVDLTTTCYPLVVPSLNGTAQQEVIVELSVPLLDAFHVELRVLEATNGVRTAVSVDSTMPGGGSVWLDTDQPGGDYKDYMLPGTDVDADIQNCSHACVHDRRCLAWTYVRSGYPAPPPFNYAPRCSLKYLLPTQLSVNASCCVSGRPAGALFSLDRLHSGSTGATSPWQGRAIVQPDPFNPDKGRIKLHVFVDGSVLEAFKDDGLERVSGRVYVAAPNVATANGISVCANATAGGGTVRLLQASAWSMNSIW